MVPNGSKLKKISGRSFPGIVHVSHNTTVHSSLAPYTKPSSVGHSV